MFSGSDSTESQNYTQWPLNASAYQSMQNEHVDWAALAHQWIKMKEAGPPIPEKKVNAPPPPIISNMSPTKGEAPMDVENDSDSNNLGSDSNDAMSWNQHQTNSWGWNNSAWPPAIPSLPMNKAALLPTPAYNAYSSHVKDDLYSTQGSGYWTGNGSPNTRGSSGPKLLKPHNKRFSKVNVPIKTTSHSHPIAQNPIQSITPPPPMIDANKRKQLPAWIREGLEKMERDKLKQIDRHHDKDKVEDADDGKKKLRENALEILKSTVKQSEPKPINDYDDSNQSDDADDETVSQPGPALQIKYPSVTLTHEEMMLKVRRTMTEILLKVTNREIAQICKEELQRNVRKKKAIDQHVTAPSAGANLSARLGLGAYVGSGDSSDESDDVDEKTEEDSDNELRDIIKRRKDDFVKVERDIESRLAEADAEKEGDIRKSRAGSPVSEDSRHSPRGKSQDRRSHTPKIARKAALAKRHSRDPPSSQSSSRSSSSSLDRRSSRRVHRRSRSSSRSRRSDGRRSERRRRYSRSRSRSYRSYRPDRRRDSRSPIARSRRSRSRSRRYSRRRTRSKTRSRSRSRNGGRGKRSHRH